MFRLNHHWFNSFRFHFSTNGINYDTQKVQDFIKKNRQHLSIGITIAGTREKHDLNRIWKTKDGFSPKPKDEKGSYDDVVRNIPLWREQFPFDGTKVTISSADIKYIKDSVLHLYSLGIHEVNINVVFNSSTSFSSLETVDSVTIKEISIERKAIDKLVGFAS